MVTGDSSNKFLINIPKAEHIHTPYSKNRLYLSGENGEHRELALSFFNKVINGEVDKNFIASYLVENPREFIRAYSGKSEELDKKYLTINHFAFLNGRAPSTKDEALLLLDKASISSKENHTYQLYRSFLEMFPNKHRFEPPLDSLRFKILFELFLRNSDSRVFVDDHFNVSFQDNDSNKDLCLKLDVLVKSTLFERYGVFTDYMLISKEYSAEEQIQKLSRDGIESIGSRITFSNEELNHLRDILKNSAIDDIYLSDLYLEKDLNLAQKMLEGEKLANENFLKRVADFVFQKGNRPETYYVARDLMKDGLTSNDYNINPLRFLDRIEKRSEVLLEEKKRAFNREELDLKKIVADSSLDPYDKADITDEVIRLFINDRLNDYRIAKNIFSAIGESFARKDFPQALDVFDREKGVPKTSTQIDFAKLMHSGEFKYPYTIEIGWRWIVKDDEDVTRFIHVWIRVIDHENKTVATAGFTPTNTNLSGILPFGKPLDDINIFLEHVRHGIGVVFTGVPGRVEINDAFDHKLSSMNTSVTLLRIASNEYKANKLIDLIHEHAKNPDVYGMVAKTNCMRFVFDLLADAGYVDRSKLFFDFKQKDFKETILTRWVDELLKMPFGSQERDKRIGFNLLMGGDLFSRIITQEYLEKNDFMSNISPRANMYCLGLDGDVLYSGNFKKSNLIYSDACVHNIEAEGYRHLRNQIDMRSDEFFNAQGPEFLKKENSIDYTKESRDDSIKIF